MIYDPLRHRREHVKDATTFGDSRFGVLAERFARSSVRRSSSSGRRSWSPYGSP